MKRTGHTLPQRALRGIRAEALALQYLRRAGLRLIERNYRVKAGEIDLVMREHNHLQDTVLVFVEVRYRASNRYGGGAASVTPTKQRRLITAATLFRQSHSRYRDWPARFDVVTVQGCLTNPEIAWLRQAFEC